jgi:hypothetical protein
MKKTPEFKVGQVVASKRSKDFYVRITGIHRGTYRVADPELGASAYREKWLRALTAREKG